MEKRRDKKIGKIVDGKIWKKRREEKMVEVKRNKQPKVIFNGKLYEEIRPGGEVRFIDKEGKVHEKVNAIYPIIDDSVFLPTGIKDYGSAKKLIGDMQNFIHSYVDVSKDFEEFVSYYALMTWVYEKYNTVPYIRVLGDFGIGKTRFLDVMSEICYKSVSIGASLTTATIFRTINDWRGTLIVDESDFTKTDEKTDIIKIFNSGFQKGKPIRRVNKDRGMSVETFEVFGPKVIASRKEFYDKALESRCFTETMRDTLRKDIPYDIDEYFHKKGEQLRNKLLKFRFDNLEGVIGVKGDMNMGIVNFNNVLGALDIENRLKQASGAIADLLHGTDAYNGFMKYLLKHNRRLIEGRSDTIEGVVVKSLSDLYTPVDDPDAPDDPQTITPSMIANQVMNNGWKSKYDIDSRYIGKVLRTLGINTIRRKENGKSLRAVEIDKEHFERLKRKYIPPGGEEPPQKTFNMSEIGEQNE